MSKNAIAVMPVASVVSKIYLIRGKRVILDSDLSELYGVQTKFVNLAVKRNRLRFPGDFMFQLTPKETQSLRLHFATSKKGRGGRRYLPHAFTQEGGAMLSGVLNSPFGLARPACSLSSILKNGACI